LPKIRIIVGIIATAIFGMGIMEMIGGIDPMHSRGMGPGWECDALGKGGDVCARDVKTLK